MQQSATGPVAPRYVRMEVTADLIGSWELVRETGQIGGRCQVRREIFPSCELALEAFEAARTSFAKRGYKAPEALQAGPSDS